MVLHPESGRAGQNRYLWPIDTRPGFCPNRPLYGGPWADSCWHRRAIQGRAPDWRWRAA